MKTLKSKALSPKDACRSITQLLRNVISDQKVAKYHDL